MYLPKEVPDDEAIKGIPIGPPSLESLGLPTEVEVRVHNQLFHRRIFTARDARLRRVEIHAAIRAALKVDTERVYQVYMNDAT